MTCVRPATRIAPAAPRRLALAAASIAATLALLASGTAHAVNDPAGDFLPSFTGSAIGALDILEAEVAFDAGENRFSVSALLADTPAGNVRYVFGFQRGQGTLNAPFGPIGFPDVKFDAVLALAPDASGAISGQPVAGEVTGQRIGASFSAALLPSDTLAPGQFSWAMWTVDLGVTGLPRNADFAPAANVAVVPEPQTWALLAAGLACVGGIARRRGRQALDRGAAPPTSTH